MKQICSDIKSAELKAWIDGNITSRSQSNKKEGAMHIVLRPRQVAKCLSISLSTLWRIQKQNDFPKKIQISPKAVGWIEDDIVNWIDERKTMQPD